MPLRQLGMGAFPLPVPPGPIGGPAPASARPGEGTLQADAVVTGGVDAAVGHAYIPAAIEVDSVAIGIDRYLIKREVIDSACQKRDVSSVADRDPAYDDSFAANQRDRLVAGVLL